MKIHPRETEEMLGTAQNPSGRREVVVCSHSIPPGITAPDGELPLAVTALPWQLLV